jgi:hypothetical protein
MGSGTHKLEPLQAAKIRILCLNVIVTIVALVNISVCVWVKIDLDFWEFVHELDW